MGERPDTDAAAVRAGVLEDERPRLVNLAYRMLGSLAEAEDAVQEAYARWIALGSQERRGITSPGAWLNTVVSRICLDLLGSARVRRERYVGQWLPEPVPDPGEWSTGRSSGGAVGSVIGGGTAPADPADRITLDESVDMAFLVVLDAMTPAERVSFLLHDVFGYPFSEIGRIVGRTPAACRQLASSARRRLRDARPVPPPIAERAEVVRRFKRAWQAADIDTLIGLLDPSAIAVADGGGRAPALGRPVEGAEEIARFLVGLGDRVRTIELLERLVNGRPGLVAWEQGRAVAVYAFEIRDSRIERMWAITNPEKLGSWPAGGRPADPPDRSATGTRRRPRSRRRTR
ncbi:RNA polymerase sigma factor SigJ [Microlunatus sp. Gsoil 973]|uniref:RNA polymerase sigma factor SigJ n=1 Tax=Microlunatus sp. Gsoil 973 TaxID=2672569 RepID=UPI0012B48DC0|nr:RNA polymerase sigma factor SigJ [Microlunatus sp. Gsoil 973]QGN34577.1 sigma-70 family RNA polymerase sigma factor [Microlunatus sp. Gsoil 973]